MKIKQWSKYNYLFDSEGKYYIYNFLSNGLGELDKDSYSYINHLISNGDVNVQDNDVYEQLLKMKALVDNDQDEINKIKYIARARRINDKRLTLTINPTLDCNFACSYCFEQQHPNIYMSDEVEDKIIHFINEHRNVRQINVTWFGGEPLLAFNRVASLTKKMQSLQKQYSAGMITNGYLLTKRVIELLPSLSVSFLQITVDGRPSLHDSRRCLKSGAPTFKRIVHNIEMLKDRHPDIMVTVRVNVDSTNEEDFVWVYQFFKEKHYPNLSVSLAFVNDLSNENKCSCIFDREQQAQFALKLRRKYNFDFGFLFPSLERYECAIRNENAIVIGPEGELYKCWNDVGDKEKVVGNIDGKVTNESLLLRYLVAADPFEDPKCKECLLLPVCGGGCPYSRIQNVYEGTDINTCLLIKDHLKEFLLTHALCKTRKNK